jgi:hypothetical protein
MKKFDQLVELVMEKCWKGYQQKGMKKKGDKMVPNCVKKKPKNKIR